MSGSRVSELLAHLEQTRCIRHSDLCGEGVDDPHVCTCGAERGRELLAALRTPRAIEPGCTLREAIATGRQRAAELIEAGETTLLYVVERLDALELVLAQIERAHWTCAHDSSCWYEPGVHECDCGATAVQAALGHAREAIDAPARRTWEAP